MTYIVGILALAAGLCLMVLAAERYGIGRVMGLVLLILIAHWLIG